MTNTQQNEAMQAVRLLYKWAAKANIHEPEALYQARQLLEGFIESAGVLRSVDTELYPDRSNLGGVGYVGRGVFTKGERIITDTWGTPPGKITRINGTKAEIAVEFDDESIQTVSFEDALRFNPRGSFK